MASSSDEEAYEDSKQIIEHIIKETCVVSMCCACNSNVHHCVTWVLFLEKSNVGALGLSSVGRLCVYAKVFRRGDSEVECPPGSRYAAACDFKKEQQN